MAIKISICLNFFPVQPHVFESIGFSLTSPVDFIFHISGSNMLKFKDENIEAMDFKQLYSLSLLNYGVRQRGNMPMYDRFNKFLTLLNNQYFNELDGGISTIP